MVQGNSLPTLRQCCANPSPTFRQPFANIFCQPLSELLFPWAPITRLETRVKVSLESYSLEWQCSLSLYRIEFFRGSPRNGDNFASLFQVLQTLLSKRQKFTRGIPTRKNSTQNKKVRLNKSISVGFLTRVTGKKEEVHTNFLKEFV